MATPSQTNPSTRAADARGDVPRVSIVIPVYNEEGILHSAVIDLIDRLRDAAATEPELASYEILLSENGSSDSTVAIGEELAARHPEVHIHSLGRPNYGAALKAGILRARGEYVLEYGSGILELHEDAVAGHEVLIVDPVHPADGRHELLGQCSLLIRGARIGAQHRDAAAHRGGRVRHRHEILRGRAGR